MTTEYNAESTAEAKEVRSAALRAGVLAIVDASPHLSRRRARTTAILLGLALLLVGGLVGGGISAVAFGTPKDPALRGYLRTDALYGIAAGYGSLVGQAHFVETSGATTITLGVGPDHANAIEIAYQCLDPGTYRISIDGQGGNVTCDTSASHVPSTKNAQSEAFTAKAGTSHRISMNSFGSHRYALWVSYAKLFVAPGPSAAQRAELAGGPITLDEYVDAFNRYEGCMAQAGFPLGHVRFINERYSYELTDAANKVSDAQCYPREFEGVDTAWQGQNH